jgi:hypothetical protein
MDFTEIYTKEKIERIVEASQLVVGKDHQKWPDLRKCLLDNLNDLKRLIDDLSKKRGGVCERQK